LPFFKIYNISIEVSYFSKRKTIMDKTDLDVQKTDSPLIKIIGATKPYGKGEGQVYALR